MFAIDFRLTLFIELKELSPLPNLLVFSWLDVNNYCVIFFTYSANCFSLYLYFFSNFKLALYFWTSPIWLGDSAILKHWCHLTAIISLRIFAFMFMKLACNCLCSLIRHGRQTLKWSLVNFCFLLFTHLCNSSIWLWSRYF